LFGMFSGGEKNSPGAPQGQRRIRRRELLRTNRTSHIKHPDFFMLGINNVIVIPVSDCSPYGDKTRRSSQSRMGVLDSRRNQFYRPRCVGCGILHRKSSEAGEIHGEIARPNYSCLPVVGLLTVFHPALAHLPEMGRQQIGFGALIRAQGAIDPGERLVAHG
jgi:hypothetical protein